MLWRQTCASKAFIDFVRPVVVLYQRSAVDISCLGVVPRKTLQADTIGIVGVQHFVFSGIEVPEAVGYAFEQFGPT